ncbi:MAG: acetyl/propionyl/methylcrotonyl-CoA carboxylase subunit alpha [Gammaproteobacteria bacterium]|nr:MAG: acetyl/propionyl/methylcrotonyl-CoA carboxylase subunit alpha [Gammaproteobacteria bacterium]
MHKILIANRGEIACRVIDTARQLGYTTVAVYSEADRQARHVRLADESVCIGPPAVSASYLNQAAILEAARATGADAIHPGYGFLSENAAFAQACIDAGLTFIGPPAEAIRLMGSKRASKIAMLEAGVPCVPGYEGEDQSDDALLAAARDIGFPVMIKASAGGGGRGMRLVHSESEFTDQLHRARSEALNAFGSDELILEKAVIAPRHIEIQVFADQQGNTLYLHERDCSVQRRHQKVVEEAPSPFVTPDLRQAMGEAAVQAARACGYVGAGTVEFLVDDARNFYFLEMNTRLQVEHPVTECITGQDLVAWQLRVAEGEPLPLKQEDIPILGHAIEVRLYAEHPGQNFMPQSGPVLRWAPPSGAGIRVDHGLVEGAHVTPHYDPMLAKIIASGPDRTTAIRRLRRALAETRVHGVTTNLTYLHRLLGISEFETPGPTTAFAETWAEKLLAAPDDATLSSLHALAALCLHLQGNPTPSPAFWNSSPTSTPYELRHEDTLTELVLVPEPHTGWQARLGTSHLALGVVAHQPGTLVATVNGIKTSVHYTLADQQLWMSAMGYTGVWEDLTHQPAAGTQALAEREITAPMDGLVVHVAVEPGQPVRAGDLIAVVEAMKMEHPLRALADGTVATLHVTPGQQVRIRQVLAELTLNESEDKQA